MTLIGKPPVRTQGDMMQTEVSRRPINNSDFRGTKDLTRQEFKNEVDVNTILNRFGVDGTNIRQPVYGVQDFDMDRQQALQAIDAAQRVYNKLPQELRDKYGTWQATLNAIESGQMAQDLANQRKAEPKGTDDPSSKSDPAS